MKKEIKTMNNEIKGSDLQIGDYVLHENVIKMVVSIPTENKVSIRPRTQTYGSIYNTTLIDEIKPLKIDGKILTLNGFQFCHDPNYERYDEYVYNNITIKECSEHENTCWTVQLVENKIEKLYITITYVHELQHLLKIIGYNNLIKL